MIIRSLLQCSRTASPRASRCVDSTFFSRFYSVMSALKVHEDHEGVEPVKVEHGRRHPAKTDIAGLPTTKRSSSMFSLKNESLAVLEDGLGRLTSSLRAIEASTAAYEGRLKDIYQARAKRRRDLSYNRISSSHDRLEDDEEYMALTTAAERLKKTMLEPHSGPFSNLLFDLQSPTLRISRTHSTRLDSRIQDLLREPCPNQLKALAHLLSSTSVPPTVKTFNIMISRLTRLRQNAAAWTVFRTMLKLRFSPTDHTISSVLNLSIVTGSYPDFRKVLMTARSQRDVDKSKDPNHIRHRRPRRNVVLFGTIIKGCVKFGHMNRAETYLKLMRAERARPNLEILTSMIQGYADRSDWNAGRPHFRALMALPWDRQVVATLIRYCRACKRPFFETQVKKLADLKGVKVGDGKDLAVLPDRWKERGLDVPNWLKLPKIGDVGAITRPLKLKASKSKSRQKSVSDRSNVVSARMEPREHLLVKNRLDRSDNFKRVEEFDEAFTAGSETKRKVRVRVFNGSRREALGKWA